MTPLTMEIARWLRQAAVWRFVGFVSSIIGLFCYGLSSSFNYLFGEWNLFKIFLFCVFSLFICLWSLFAHSTTLQFKAHSAFLVLTITSVYSYFADKAVKGKPDVYSLISCVAFSIMSLSLSRQTKCGFEVDLFYFFLGCLIVLLMKIKLALGVVGVGFSYALIILRSSLDTVLDENDGVEDENSAVNSQQLAHTDIASSMQQLVTYIEAIQQGNSNLTEHVKKYLDNNHELAVMDHNLYEGASTGEYIVIVTDELLSRTLNDLQEMAKRMFANGFGKEWLHVYTNRRREFLEESISRLGFQKLSVKDINKMTWQELKKEIDRWIIASNVAFKIIFPSERRLCDHIYLGFSNAAADISFLEICKVYATELLSFAEALATGSRSPERLFQILDVFETLGGLIPEFDALFCDELGVLVRNEAISIWKRLEEEIGGVFNTLMELECLIRPNPAKKRAVPGSVSGGGLHPITHYVMNYLLVACRSRQTLDQVFQHHLHPLKQYAKLHDKV